MLNTHIKSKPRRRRILPKIPDVVNSGSNSIINNKTNIIKHKRQLKQEAPVYDTLYYILNKRCYVAKYGSGTLRFYGRHIESDRIMCGIEFDNRDNSSLNAPPNDEIQQCFACQEYYGLFIEPYKVIMYDQSVKHLTKLLKQNNHKFAWIIPPFHNKNRLKRIYGNKKGLAIYENGNIYSGHFHKQVRHGIGELFLPNRNFYEGRWNNGTFKKMIQYNIWWNSNVYYIYTGKLVNDLPQGRGQSVSLDNKYCYKGMWENGKRQGQGVYVSANNYVYKGMWENGKRQGQGIYAFANNYTYNGMWENGKRQGQGICIFLSTGNIYDGMWKNGKYHGKGKYTNTNNWVYKGTFKNGILDGQGKMTYANGKVYEGTFKNGVPDGQGKMTYANGKVYEGMFKNDVIDGQGILTIPNRSRYKGNFKDSKRDGQGESIYANLDVYQGMWKSNLKDGYGKMTYRNGDVYEGLWENGKRNGQGKMTYINRIVNVYYGMWKNDKKHGPGKAIYPDGSVYEGIWENNQCIYNRGKMTYANGNVYEGQLTIFQNSLAADGQGKMTYVSGDVYQGMWKKGEQDGQGKKTYAIGYTYQGLWRNGMRHGRGIHTYMKEGITIEGQWYNNKFSGKGILKCPRKNNFTYNGNLRTNQDSYKSIPYGKGQCSHWIVGGGTKIQYITRTGTFTNWFKLDGEGKETIKIYENENLASIKYNGDWYDYSNRKINDINAYLIDVKSYTGKFRSGKKYGDGILQINNTKWRVTYDGNGEEKFREIIEDKTPVESQNKSCCICMEDGASTHLFVPCGHKCICEECVSLQVWEECPVCRQKLTRQPIKVYEVS